MTTPSQNEKRKTMSTRHEKILDMVRQRGFVSVIDLAEHLKVSDMTVRRDLVQLDNDGLLMRTHGGAMTLEEESQVAVDIVEPDFSLRMSKSQAQKLKIAQSARELVFPNATIALDVGTTASLLAKELSSLDNIKLFTNNLHAAIALAPATYPVYLSGGQMRTPELSINGPLATQQIRNFRFDVAFIGVSGINPAGIFDYSIEDSETKRLYMENAQEVIVLCDSSKFGHISVVHIGDLGKISGIVTDKMPTGALLEALQAANVNIICAEEH